MKRLLYILNLSLAVSLASCEYKSVPELGADPFTCHTENMSYSRDIVPILIEYGCVSCHGDFNPVDLANYTGVKDQINDGALLGSIKHTTGYTPMPANGPQMDSCNIAKIEAWIAQGATDN